MPQNQGVKGEVPPLAGYHTAFPTGNKQGHLLIQDSTFSEFLNDFNFSQVSAWLVINLVSD